MYEIYQQNNVGSRRRTNVGNQGTKVATRNTYGGRKQLHTLDPHNKPTNITDNFGSDSQYCNDCAFDIVVDEYCY